MKYLFLMLLQAMVLNGTAQVKNKNYIEKQRSQWIMNDRPATWKEIKLELNTVDESRYFLKKSRTSQIIGLSSLVAGTTFLFLGSKDSYNNRRDQNFYPLMALGFLGINLYFQLNAIKQRKRAVMAYNYGNSR